MVFYLMLGIVIGFVLAVIGIYNLKSGTLKIYIPDLEDESPYLYVDLDKPVDTIMAKKHVVFAVDTKNISSQK